MDINKEKEIAIQQIVASLEGKLKDLPNYFAHGGRIESLKSKFKKDYNVVQNAVGWVSKKNGLKIGVHDIFSYLGANYEMESQYKAMEDQWKKDNAFKTIFGKCQPDDLYALREFFKEGWPPNASSRLPKEYVRVHGVVANFNKKYKQEVSIEEFFAYLGADYSIQNNPLDREVLRGLWEIMEDYGTVENINEVAPTLHRRVTGRANTNHMSIDDYLRKLGNFDYTKKLIPPEERLKIISKLAGESKFISVHAVAEHINVLKVRASENRQTLQEFILEHTGVHIVEEASITADPIEYLKELLEKAGEKDLTGLATRNPSLYYKLDHQFQISGSEIVTMGDFMTTHLPAFSIGGKWASREKKGVRYSEEETLQMLGEYSSREKDFSDSERREMFKAAYKYARDQGFQSAREYYEHHGIKIIGANSERFEGTRVKDTLENFTAPIGQKEIDRN